MEKRSMGQDVDQITTEVARGQETIDLSANGSELIEHDDPKGEKLDQEKTVSKRKTEIFYRAAPGAKEGDQQEV